MVNTRLMGAASVAVAVAAVVVVVVVVVVVAVVVGSDGGWLLVTCGGACCARRTKYTLQARVPYVGGVTALSSPSPSMNDEAVLQTNNFSSDMYTA